MMLVTTTDRLLFDYHSTAVRRQLSRIVDMTIALLDAMSEVVAWRGDVIVRPWLQLRFDFDSTGVRRPFDCLSKFIKVTVT